MPTYDYRCAKCGEDLEVYQTFSEAPLTRHKGCGGKLAKVLSPAGIVLKGSGFYKTDNRSSGKKSSDRNGKESGGKDSSTGGDSSTKADSTSESKSSSDSSSPGSSSSDSKKPAAKSA